MLLYSSLCDLYIFNLISFSMLMHVKLHFMVSLWVIVSRKTSEVSLGSKTSSTSPTKCGCGLERILVFFIFIDFLSPTVESSLIVYGSPETPWLFSHPQSNLLKSWNDPSLLKWYPALVLMGKDLLFSEIDTNTESEHVILFVICWRECRRTLHSPRFRVRFGTVFFRHAWLKCLTKLVFSVIYLQSQ